MKRILRISNCTPLLLGVVLLSSCTTATKEYRTVRVAVIGGMMRSGLWPELAKQFEAERGCRVELVLSGNRDLVAEAFRAGKVDLAAMHAGTTASKLVLDGYGRNMRPWTRNEFAIIGPRSDPAGIRGMSDGAAALARIARTKALFVNYQNSGPREVASALWKKAGIHPEGDWLLDDESNSSEEAIEFARKKQAYLLLGRIPVLQGSNLQDGLEILVQDDPEMQRSFIVLEAALQRFPEANVKGAHSLADFLLRPKTQDFLFAFATNSPPGMPLFYPVRQH